MVETMVSKQGLSVGALASILVGSSEGRDDGVEEDEGMAIDVTRKGDLRIA